MGELSLFDPEIIYEDLEKVPAIRDRLYIAYSRQKSYPDNGRKDLEFQRGDNVYLKISPMKGVMRFCNKGNLSL